MFCAMPLASRRFLGQLWRLLLALLPQYSPQKDAESVLVMPTHSDLK